MEIVLYWIAAAMFYIATALSKDSPWNRFASFLCQF